MNDHFEELIHNGIDQLTAGSTLPAGLAGRARQRVRRRQYQLRASLAAGTAAAAAIAVIAATSAGSAGPAPRHSAGTRPSATVALLAKIERAVASKAGSAPVLQIKTTFPVGKGVIVPFDPFTPDQLGAGRGVQDVRSTIMWTRGNVLKWDETEYPKGQIGWVTLLTERGTRGTATRVDYFSRYWTQTAVDWTVDKKYLQTCDVLPRGAGDPHSWAPRTLAKEIKNAIACGQVKVKVAGRQRVDGLDTIKLAFTPGQLDPGHPEDPWNHPGRGVTHQTMWVDAHRYLPVRYLSTLTYADAKSGSGKKTVSTQSDFQWLPPTRSALAKLRLIIPSGFRHVRPHY